MELVDGVRYKLFMDYFEELSEYLTEKPTKSEVFSWFLEYINGEYEWLDVYYEKEYVGFVIIATGTSGECGFYNCDYYIAQTYMHRDFRRKGLMESKVIRYADSHPGKYALTILDRNIRAKMFWGDVSEKMDVKFKVARQEKGEKTYSFKIGGKTK